MSTFCAVNTTPKQFVSFPNIKWNTLVGVIALIIKFAYRQFQNNLSDIITLIIRNEQRVHPPTEDEIKNLCLNFEAKHEVWRVRTRLQETKHSYESINPLWISNKSKILYCFIEAKHDERHNNALNTTAIVRQTIWTSYRTVKSVIKSCIHCRIFYDKPFPMPTRVLVRIPFDCVGIDMAGPIHLTTGHAYYLLIICLKVRAVHLEVVPTLLTNDFIVAFKKFVALRGMPSYILSYNAT